jgi:hypothetical protein
MRQPRPRGRRGQEEGRKTSACRDAAMGGRAAVGQTSIVPTRVPGSFLRSGGEGARCNKADFQGQSCQERAKRMKHGILLLFLCMASCYVEFAGSFSTSMTPIRIGIQRNPCNTRPASKPRHLSRLLSIRAVWSSDENRRDEQRKILLGKRVAVASTMNAKGAWALLPDEMNSRYEVKGELGRGAFGCVVLAEEKETGSKVAIKVHPLNAVYSHHFRGACHAWHKQHNILPRSPPKKTISCEFS